MYHHSRSSSSIAHTQSRRTVVLPHPSVMSLSPPSSIPQEGVEGLSTPKDIPSVPNTGIKEYTLNHICDPLYDLRYIP